MTYAFRGWVHNLTVGGSAQQHGGLLMGWVESFAWVLGVQGWDMHTWCRPGSIRLNSMDWISPGRVKLHKPGACEALRWQHGCGVTHRWLEAGGQRPSCDWTTG